MKLAKKIKDHEEEFSKVVIDGIKLLNSNIYKSKDYEIEKDSLMKLIELIDDMDIDSVNIKNEQIKLALMDIVSRRIVIINDRDDLFNNGMSLRVVRDWIIGEVVKKSDNKVSPCAAIGKLDRAFEMLLVQTCITWFNTSTQKKLQMLVDSNRQLSIEKSSSSGILEAINLPIMIFKNDTLDYVNIAGVKLVNSLRKLDEQVNYNSLMSKLAVSEHIGQIQEGQNEITYKHSISGKTLSISAMNHYAISGKLDGIIVTILNSNDLFDTRS